MQDHDKNGGENAAAHPSRASFPPGQATRRDQPAALPRAGTTRRAGIARAWMAAVAATLCAALIAPGPARAQDDWPSKPLTLLIPYAPGGTTDIIGRILADKVGRILGQTVVADNRGGAGGTIAGTMLSRSNPDGYTIMLEHIGFAFNATLYPHLSYEPLKDITPVAYVGQTPNVLVVTNSMPVHNIKEFLDYARAHPGAVNYGSGGVGSAGHLPMAWLQSKQDLKLTHIPYKGSGPAITDLISGRIEAMLLTIPAVLPYIRSGQVRPLATSGAQRAASLPDLPTMLEAGIKGFDYEPWYGVFVRTGTPPAVVAKLHDAINKALQDPDTQKRMLEQGLAVSTWTQQKFQQQVHDDTEKWHAIITSLNIKMN
ncbi:Bug family tripartite tricarboxylate transporter substrate binding protein [Bordetella sp. H567]|uniref:Bug family tripartite tricarboxylate transporter substrate binding protein n=1 Tax=Bordetella sp. H567 TaxID=1697043 RepID=UPI0009F482C6|nr:tripartite tricarboxylate transporter substrate binding protein [Bordetella sp. H567]